MHIIIVGSSKEVYYLSRLFISKGYSVTIINRKKEECVWFSRHLEALVIFGDGSDPQILEEAGASNTDAILAITPNDQDNLAICQLGMLRFNVPRTLALVNDPDNEIVFKKLGITAISTTRILSSLIEQSTDFEEITNLIPVGEGKINVTEITLSKTSSIIGRSLQEIDLPESSLIASILRGNRVIIPRGGTVLEKGDRLVVITLPDNHGLVLRKLSDSPV